MLGDYLGIYDPNGKLEIIAAFGIWCLLLGILGIIYLIDCLKNGKWDE